MYAAIWSICDTLLSDLGTIIQWKWNVTQKIYACVTFCIAAKKYINKYEKWKTEGNEIIKGFFCSYWMSTELHVHSTMFFRIDFFIFRLMKLIEYFDLVFCYFLSFCWNLFFIFFALELFCYLKRYCSYLFLIFSLFLAYFWHKKP